MAKVVDMAEATAGRRGVSRARALMGGAAILLATTLSNSGLAETAFAPGADETSIQTDIRSAFPQFGQPRLDSGAAGSESFAAVAEMRPPPIVEAKPRNKFVIDESFRAGLQISQPFARSAIGGSAAWSTAQAPGADLETGIGLAELTPVWITPDAAGIDAHITGGIQAVAQTDWTKGLRADHDGEGLPLAATLPLAAAALGAFGLIGRRLRRSAVSH